MSIRVIAAMSGGVDSSVTAALLSEEEYEVIGVTMRLGTYSGVETGSERPLCCSLESVEDARRVAAQLGIPFYVVNYEEDFARDVVDYFCEEYSAGRTPNPCVMCNTKLKFGKLLKLAYEMGAQYVATGHYARIAFASESGRYLLKKGVDGKKDQSYALFDLTQEQLKHALLPLGEYNKNQVRNMARKRGLKTQNRPESQEICFIPDDNYNQFLMDNTPERIKPGQIFDTQGGLLGEHRGIQFYTIGQRRGLGISLGKPAYVIDIDAENNTIIVGDKHELLRKSFLVEKINLITYERLSEPIRAQVKVRYKDPGHWATVSPISDDKAEVSFDEPQRAITPGQAAVFYDDDVVIGGGWIATMTEIPQAC